MPRLWGNIIRKQNRQRKIIDRQRLLVIKLAVAEQDWRRCYSVHITNQWFKTCGPRTPGVPCCYCNEFASPYAVKAQTACGNRIKVQTFIFSTTPSIYETCRSCTNHLIKFIHSVFFLTTGSKPSPKTKLSSLNKSLQYINKYVVV